MQPLMDRPILDPVMMPERPAEDVLVPGQISGQQIIDDLANRIAEKLATSCNLRATDCYSQYAARVRIELQLTDIGPVDAVVAEVYASLINPARPSTYLDLDAVVVAEEPAESLEVCVDGSMPEPATATATKQRYYTPRGQRPVPLE